MIFPLGGGEPQILLRAFIFHFYSSIIVRRPLGICVLRTNLSNYWLCALSLQGLDVVNTQPMPPAFHLVSSVRWHHTCVCSCPASLHKAAPVCHKVQMGLKEQGWALLTNRKGRFIITAVHGHDQADTGHTRVSAEGNRDGGRTDRRITCYHWEKYDSWVNQMGERESKVSGIWTVNFMSLVVMEVPTILFKISLSAHSGSTCQGHHTYKSRRRVCGTCVISTPKHWCGDGGG